MAPFGSWKILGEKEVGGSHTFLFIYFIYLSWKILRERIVDMTAFGSWKLLGKRRKIK